MLISKKLKTQIPNLNLNLYEEKINQVDSCQYLGVTLDSHMKFAEQFDITYCKLKKAIGIFTRAAQFIPTSACITLYNTLILPHLDYCSTVWSPSLCKKDLVKLQRIQNRAMRTILKCHPRTHITDMLDTLQWMSIKQRLHYNYCIFLWKIQNKQTPQYLNNYFTATSEIHTHNTRFSTRGSIYLQRSHPKSLNNIGPKIWNEIPQHIRDASSLFSFKKSILAYIFSSVERF